MTEDEAFIRAVVDNPGDDTPRLVYADWLDERNDPRGAYLRAELEWAKPWREGIRPDYSFRLWEESVPLNQLWVARVSRPPHGVCCEHFVMEEPGPTVTIGNLTRFEKEHELALPVQYRAFLLNHNGGQPYPAGKWLPASAEPFCGDERYWFYSLSLTNVGHFAGSLQYEVTHYRTLALPRFLQREPGPLPRYQAEWYTDFIPMCRTPDIIITLLIGVRGIHAGTVYGIDWSVEPVPYNQRHAHSDLAMFLYEFRPPAEFDVPDQSPNPDKSYEV